VHTPEFHRDGLTSQYLTAANTGVLHLTVKHEEYEHTMWAFPIKIVLKKFLQWLIPFLGHSDTLFTEVLKFG
jgi:hypothetical protein